MRTADLVYDLASSRKSALYQRIDLTGEQSGIALKQGSVAPAINSLVGSSRAPLAELGYDVQLKALMDYVAAMRECDPDAWDRSHSPLYAARVFRATMRLMGDIISETKAADVPMSAVNAPAYLGYLERIDLDTLNSETIKASQGSAGIKAIYDTLRAQVFGA